MCRNPWRWGLTGSCRFNVWHQSLWRSCVPLNISCSTCCSSHDFGVGHVRSGGPFAYVCGKSPLKAVHMYPFVVSNHFIRALTHEVPIPAAFMRGCLSCLSCLSLVANRKIIGAFSFVLHCSCSSIGRRHVGEQTRLKSRTMD